MELSINIKRYKLVLYIQKPNVITELRKLSTLMTEVRYLQLTVSRLKDTCFIRNPRATQHVQLTSRYYEQWRHIDAFCPCQSTNYGPRHNKME